MIWLIGAGNMAKEYVKVLQGLEVDFKVIGRGENSAEKFLADTGLQVVKGGLDEAIANTKKEDLPKKAIISTNVESLAQNVESLLKVEVKEILVEKPAAITIENIQKITAIAKECQAKVYVAYNRRFLASVLALEENIKQDGGLRSFTFEFTEWVDRIGVLEKSKEAFDTWFLGNSTHVVDLAFFLGGNPKELSCYTQGEIDWHKSASYFSGAGITDKSALFSYYAGWDSPGRWALEFMTKNNRFYLKPMEKLAVQKRNTVNLSDVEVDYSIDDKFKPGLYLLAKAFIQEGDENRNRLCTLEEQNSHFEMYYKMANYSPCR